MRYFCKNHFPLVTHLSEQNSVLNRFVAELRDVHVQTDRMRFRRNLERIGEIMAYEISKTLQYQLREVETPLGIAKVSLPTNRIILATILRAGLPLHQGMLQVFDDAENAFISAYRHHHKDGTFEINLGYISCPGVRGSTLILCDPMLATGSSLNIVLKEINQYGEPAEIHVATVIASSYGISQVKRLHPKVRIWAAAIDEELTAKSYIVPGLGDAGDLAFGEKVQD